MVEDHDDTREMLCLLGEAWGFRVSADHVCSEPFDVKWFFTNAASRVKPIDERQPTIHQNKLELFALPLSALALMPDFGSVSRG